MISFDDASDILRGTLTPLESVDVAPGDAHGLVLADDLTARLSSPRADLSAMDGYAIRDADLPGPFQLIGTSSAGSTESLTLSKGQAVRIFTGAPLPDGADRVIVQEIAEQSPASPFALVRLVGNFGDSRYIRPTASDYAAGDTLLTAGTRLGPRQLVLAAAADRAAVSVWRRPRVAILSTGDELAAPGMALETPGAIPDSVAIGIAALARAWGGEVVGTARSADHPEEIGRTSADLLARADVLVTIGGASVGDRDFARSSLAHFSFEQLFSRVAIRPGKPVWCAAGADKLVLGLPGNPTSAMVTARLFLAPMLAALSGASYDDALAWEVVTLFAPLPAPGEREHFARARRLATGAEPLSNQLSSSQAMLALGDLLLRQPGGSDGLPAGTNVNALAF